MGEIQALFAFLSTRPGSSVYHFLILLAMEAAVGIAFTEYRHTRNPDQRRLLWSFAVLVVLRVPLLIGGSLGEALLAPLLYALEVASLTLVAWAFLAPFLGRRGARAFLLGNLIVAVGLTLFFLPSWYQMLSAVPFFPYVAFWQQPLWDLWGVLLALAAMLLHLAHRRRLGYSLPAVAFAFITVGNSLVLFDLVGPGRVVNLIGYPLLAVSVYRAALQDLWAYRSELGALSEGALRQTQELLFLLDIGRTLGQSFDLEGALSRVAENVAHALDADRVAILLQEEEADRLRLVAQYVPLQRRGGPSTRHLSLSQYALLQYVMRRKKQLMVNSWSHPSRIRPLYKALGAHGDGPVILQPLVRERRALGLLFVGNDHSGRPFGAKEARLCDAVGTQIAAAVENVRLYRQLGEQARELKAALEAREREGRWLEAVLESIAEGVIVADREGRAVRVNAAAERILGVDRERVLGRPLAQLLTSATGQEVLWDRLRQSLEPLQILFELEQKQVQVRAALIHSPYDGEVMGLVAVLRDITKEVQAERAKRDFITTVSHELRTPLTAILGYAEVLYSQMAGKLTDAQKRFVQTIHANARRMITIANNLIALAEAERGRLELQYEETDLALILGEVVESFIPQMRAREVEWSLEIEDALPLIEADPERIRQIVTNLVSNAVKYTFPGGRVTVGAGMVREPDGEAHYCRIWVQDTGIGIPPEEQSLIWERFYRPKDPLRVEAGGLGLGLAVVRSLTEAHGGRVWVDSTPGKGSTFTVLLPACRPSPSLSEGEGEAEYPGLEETVG